MPKLSASRHAVIYNKGISRYVYIIYQHAYIPFKAGLVVNIILMVGGSIFTTLKKTLRPNQD